MNKAEFGEKAGKLILAPEMEQLSRTNVAKRDMSLGGEPSEDSKRELISQWISSLVDSNEASKKLIGPPSGHLDTYEEIVEASMMAM